MVNSVEEVTANDVPMNAPFAIFPKADGSEVYIKSWSANGLIQTVTYKPQLEEAERITERRHGNIVCPDNGAIRPDRS